MFVLALPYLMLLSLLPERFSRRARDNGAPLAAGTLLTAILEVVLGATIGVLGYIDVISQKWTGPGGAPSGFGWSAATYLGFLFFSPKGWAALYFIFEGIVRVLAAASRDACGNLILAGMDRAYLAITGARAARMLAPLQPDRVSELDRERLQISSVRERDWDEMTTLEIGGREYRITGSREYLDRPHRYVYDLSPVPSGWMVRRRVVYTPEAILAERPGPYRRMKPSF